ncbi:MAG: NAD(P)H-dependent oxidoreductase subunit E [Pseudomonadota bacterium]
MSSIAAILAEHDGREGPLLPILHDLQKAFGHISEDAMREIASALNLTRAEVYGVVSFYHDFRKEAETRPVIKLCRAEACKARGVEALMPVALAQNSVKVEAVYCLGLCAVGPAAMIGDTVYARLDAERLTALMAST